MKQISGCVGKLNVADTNADRHLLLDKSPIGRRSTYFRQYFYRESIDS